MQERRITIQDLGAPQHLVPLSIAEPYVAVTWACDDSFNTDQRYEIAWALIASGCRYMVSGGVDCSL